jgi:serine phosphatase RsbU (regulator of sigma subunit)
MEIQVAVAKRDKFFPQGSGDTLEIIERPNGGISLVMADGKLDHVDSKLVSNKVVHRVINLISEGMHDGNAVRSAGAMLFHDFSGKATSSLVIISCDLDSETIVITDLCKAPVAIYQDDHLTFLSSDNLLLGEKEHTDPTITQIPILPDTSVIMFTEGIMDAGCSYGLFMDMPTSFGALFEDQEPSASEIAEYLLSQAVGLDQGEPKNDMCVAVLQVIAQDEDPVRRMTVRLPIL